jgi:hypothetical protein
MSKYADIGLYRWSQSEEPPVPYKIVLSTFLIGFEVRHDMTLVANTHVLDPNWHRILL